MVTVLRARKRAVLTMSVEAYKRHTEAYKGFGYYKGDYMSDRFIDMMIHKETYFTRSAPEKKRKEAEAWLTEHGYSLEY